MQITGAITALVTPFSQGKIDEEKLREFIEWQIEEGIDGLSPCGTTGESATLSHKEHEDVIRICIDQAKGRVPVIAGAGSNNTAESIRLAKYAKSIGADAILLITPYYNRPSQEGLFQHFKEVCKAAPMPTFAYNVPSRTGISLTPETMARMYKEIPEIIGVKEATGDMVHVSKIIEYCGDDFILLSGDDLTLLPSMALGGKGVISVTSNIKPKEFSRMCLAANNGDYKTAQKLHFELSPLCRACFIETNPVPVKKILSMMGKMESELRLPLVGLLPENEKKLSDAIKHFGLL